MMNSTAINQQTDHELCTWRPQERCRECDLSAQLMCRFERGDLIRFLLAFFPFGFIVIAGVIRAGYGLYLLGWVTYGLFFFFVWEARVLCRHCPYWAEESRVLHCHANYGVIKAWRYDPRPMSASEKAQFILGALIFVAYPFPFLLLGQQFAVASFALVAAALSGYTLRRHGCSRCINFSCPANAVPRPLVDAYLRHNPVMRTAWEESGYRLG
jgi:hypothetical protein